MNPNENNPVSPMGTGGAMDGTTPAPSTGSMDFTNPANLETSNGLNANGATGEGDGTSGMDSMNIDGTATAGMTPPMPPLTPADPVPGSIGSVTSVPPLAPEPMDMSALSSTASSNMPVMGQSAEDKPATAAEGTPSNSPYYNPFTRNNVADNNSAKPETAAAPASSTTVPPALQPKTDKFSDRLNGAKNTENKPSNMMTLLGWLLAALFAVAAIVFAILWQSAEGKKEIVYYPAEGSGDEQNPEEPDKPGADEGNDDEQQPPVATTGSVLKCGMDESVENVQGMEGVTGARGEVTVNYATDGALSDLGMTAIYTFADNDAATAAKPTIDALNEMINAVMGEGMVISTGVSQINNVISQGYVLAADALTAEGVTLSIDLPKKEDGSLDTNIDAMKGALEAQGYVCTVE